MQPYTHILNKRNSKKTKIIREDLTTNPAPLSINSVTLEDD